MLHFLSYLKAGEWNVEHILTGAETCDRAIDACAGTAVRPVLKQNR
jgi:hypothetical protein